MKKILYLYLALLWSFAQLFTFGCLIAVIDKYYIKNSAPKDQADIVALVMMIVFIIIGVWIDAGIRKYDRLYMMLLDAIASPVRFILQIVTIVKFHQNGNPKNFAPRGGYYTSSFREWAMYVLFSTVSLSPEHQYTPPKKYTGPRVVFEEEPYQPKKRSTTTPSCSQAPQTPSVYSDEYQSKYWTCKHCRYYTTYKKQVEGFLITSVEHGWCKCHGWDTTEWGSKCYDFVKK